MTYGDIKNKYYKERTQLTEQINFELLKELNNRFQNAGYEVFNISVDFEKYETAGTVMYDFKLPDGYEQTDSAYWEWDNSVSDIAQNIQSHVDYVAQLRREYSDYALQNDHIQRYRDYKRVCKLTQDGNTKEAHISAVLCGYLKLPNTTEYSVGGGNYALRRTPQRVEDFNNNIDTLCLFLADCIGELREMKLKQPEI